jgi:hypothetical protein
MGYRQRKKRRLKLWVDGILIHIDGDDCLPDFSCCRPELLAPKEERELFVKLYFAGKHKEYEKMMMMFLGRAMSLLTDKKVYISGGKP